MTYVTLSEFKSYIAEMTGGVQTSFSTAEDALLQTFLNEAQAELETKAERRFEGMTSTRKFGAGSIHGAKLLLDDDLVSVTEVINGDGAAIAESDYVLLPRNRTPKFAIELINGKSWATAADVQVTGTWGFSAAPSADCKRVIKRLAFFFWQKRTNTGENVVIGESAIQTAAEYPADVKSWIMLHRREEFA